MYTLCVSDSYEILRNDENRQLHIVGCTKLGAQSTICDCRVIFSLKSVDISRFLTPANFIKTIDSGIIGDMWP